MRKGDTMPASKTRNIWRDADEAYRGHDRSIVVATINRWWASHFCPRPFKVPLGRPPRFATVRYGVAIIDCHGEGRQ